MEEAKARWALRCLRRRLSDTVHRQLLADAASSAAAEAGPGGHPGAATPQSSAADRSPEVGTSEQPQPAPAR